MKVYLSKPRYHWISPYTILEKVFFWREIDYDEPIIDRLSNLLTPVSTAVMKVLNFVHPEVQYVKIDKWDTWSMDHTLTPIILPMLKQLKETKHGSQMVDLEDVPEHMRTTNTEDYDDQLTFDFYKESDLHGWGKKGYDIHDRWSWVLDQMIWSFEQLNKDWEAQYHTGVTDVKSVPCEWDENGKPTLYTFEKGPNDTSHFDVEGYIKHSERIDNGLKLFGKYFRGLWD